MKQQSAMGNRNRFYRGQAAAAARMQQQQQQQQANVLHMSRFDMDANETGGSSSTNTTVTNPTTANTTPTPTTPNPVNPYAMQPQGYHQHIHLSTYFSIFTS
jgi:hypothetical protein